MGASTVMARLDSVEQDKIESILESQTLPKTTSTDNGKVLTVKSGKWAKAEPATGVLVVNATIGNDSITLDKTWQQIYDAPYAVITSPMGDSSKGYARIDVIQNTDDVYSVTATMGGDSVTFTTDSADDYPVAEE